MLDRMDPFQILVNLIVDRCVGEEKIIKYLDENADYLKAFAEGKSGDGSSRNINKPIEGWRDSQGWCAPLHSPIYIFHALVASCEGKDYSVSSMNRIVEKMLDLGAKIDAVNVKTGKTPLMEAALSTALGDGVGFVKIFARESKAINHQGVTGRTALSLLLCRPKEAIKDLRKDRQDLLEGLKALLDAGADPRIADKEGKTPLDYVRENKSLSPTDKIEINRLLNKKISMLKEKEKESKSETSICITIPGATFGFLSSRSSVVENNIGFHKRVGFKSAP